ncbi:MAG: hypothetical protein CL678_16660 [Bdellovibrionaceae bacterium]|nr:hypothetical protein [Pseudobdellovibrionaceae bacterium]
MMAPKYVEVGRGSSSGVYYVGNRDDGVAVLSKPYDSENIKPVERAGYKTIEQEQLLEIKWALDRVGHPLGRMFWIQDNDLFMRYKGPTLETLGFFDDTTLEALGSYVTTMCQDFEDIGIAFPDWKPANVCAAPVIKLIYEGVYSRMCNQTLEPLIAKCKQQICAIVGAESDAFQQQLLSVESVRPSFTDDVEITIIFERAPTADTLMSRDRFGYVMLGGRYPTIAAGTEYTVIDYNALYVMDTANDAQKSFRPARGTFCPFGADYEHLHENRQVMLYGMYFAAGCLMAWARLRHFEDTQKDRSEMDSFVQLASRVDKSRRPTTREGFLEQHAVIQAANNFIGGVRLPDPVPVANFLESCYILRPSGARETQRLLSSQ